MGRFVREHVESQYKLENEADAYLAFLEQVARRDGKLVDSPLTTRPTWRRPG